MIATRYIAEWYSDPVGWEQILQVGRGLSAALDMLTVLLVYLIAQRLTNWKWAALAGLFSAAAVLQIQQSHFFTVDSFATTFTTLAVYLAVVLATEVDGLTNRMVALLSILFGATVGLGMACKLNTFPVALLLPAAFAVRWLRLPGVDPELEDDSRGDLLELNRWKGLLILAGLAAAGGLAAFLVFRVAQPYAFSGPGFFNISIDEGWLKSINDLRAQSAGDVDFPPALQWARRSHLFSLKNMVLWGLGAAAGAAGLGGLLPLRLGGSALPAQEKMDSPAGIQEVGRAAGVGLDGFLFHLAVDGMEPYHALPIAHLSDPGGAGAWGLAYVWRWEAERGGNGLLRASRQDPAGEAAGGGSGSLRASRQDPVARASGGNAIPPTRSEGGKSRRLWKTG